MAEEQDDSNQDTAPQLPDFGPLLERANRLLHGLPGKKLTPVSPSQPLPEGGETPHPSPLPASGAREDEADDPWTEEGELARLKSRIEAVRLPIDGDDLNEAINDKMREGYDIPRFVYSYLEALRAQERRRRRRSRAEPKTRHEAARLIGRLMGQIEIAMDDYLADTYEITSCDGKPRLMLAGARMGATIAQMGAALGALESEAKRIKLDYEIRHATPGGESEAE